MQSRSRRFIVAGGGCYDMRCSVGWPATAQTAGGLKKTAGGCTMRERGRGAAEGIVLSGAVVGRKR
jgi:hypothetical protein